MMKELSISFNAIWLNNLTKVDIENYLVIQENVFKINYCEKKFKKKFCDNIYGESLFIFAITEDKCVGAMVFWRNDIVGQKAYQPCEMAVLNEYRGHGIFPKMNTLGLEYIEEETLLYNFPNDSSLPSYVKMGWSIHSRERYKILNPITDFKEIMKVDEKYQDWLLNETNNKNKEFLKYIYFKKKYYLVQIKANKIFLLIGEINRKSALSLNRVKFAIVLHYSCNGYIGRGIIRVTRVPAQEVVIPLYKIGPLF